MEYFKQYWKLSKSPIYSLVFVLPLVIVYEILIFSLNHSDIVGIRNGADALFRQFFSMFGIFGFYLVGFVVMLVLFLIYKFQEKGKKQQPFQQQFFFLMFMESLLYAYLLRIILDKLLFISLMDIDALSIREKIAMCIGAGVYEELIFRIIFLQAAFIIAKFVFRFSRTISGIIALVVSSFIFSWFHYIGVFGDPLEIISFLFRFLAGALLGTIFMFRGYGVAVYTHALYDLLLFV
ncbi:MAG: CPBP family intramembrane metalloprotease [Candidatus Marinimicrobia bacterium]|nr:CPBP family intramembrane metalloprotease [Candidatus Neomarinimicrobiota bacterium]